MISVASEKHVKQIKFLVDYWAGRGDILPRDENTIRNGINDFIVLNKDGAVVATVSIVGYTQKLAELRSLCVHPDHLGKDFGTKIVTAAENEARKRGSKIVFVLTRKPAFFARLGFERGTVRSEKIYKDCIGCPLYEKGCDEVYMEKKL